MQTADASTNSQRRRRIAKINEPCKSINGRASMFNVCERIVSIDELLILLKATRVVKSIGLLL